MALHRLVCVVLLGLVALGACSQQRRAGQSAPKPVVEVMPATKATVDVDRRATLVLKQELVTRFPQNSASATVEAALVKDGYACGQNPTAPAERACLKTNREGRCEVNIIVRSTPYLPEKAQIIRICEVSPTK